ncbi:peroxidase, family 2 domain-containing protein [Trichoderma breve]|uniref:Peroxidase, family 2 domain-containing protein n=1 Tax=Trichoderma breve TaxID=2034170 RepID=A0A9W9BBE4_9HYPO|nr:peroxidase, family 2 domain-containing protein [Trichoderma breve]KAJ4860050.1 peroxidase, family 2 domain-containing protein [Trichoderma breve]
MASKIAIASLIALSAASEGLRPWEAPGPNDLRSPCPMLNTLANHGYLPHDGRDISAQQFADAAFEVVNIDPMAIKQVANYFLRASNQTSINLTDLNRPGILQHIASLTRDDVTSPDSVDVTASQDRIRHLIQDSDTDCITIASLAKTRLHVEDLSSPKELTLKEQTFAYAEAGLLLLTMIEGEVPSGWSFPPATAYCAPKKRVETWLTEERFPEELGWKKSERTIGLMDFVPVIKGIYEEKRSQAGKGPLWKAFVPSFLQQAGTDSEL